MALLTYSSSDVVARVYLFNLTLIGDCNFWYARFATSGSCEPGAQETVHGARAAQRHRPRVRARLPCLDSALL